MINSVSKVYSASIVIASAALLLTSCDQTNSDLGWWELEQDRIELNTRLELRKLKYDRAPSGSAASELNACNDLIKQQSIKINVLYDKKKALSEDLLALEKQLPSFKIATVQQRRQSAIGMDLPQISVRSGREHREVKIKSIDDLGVTISHTMGIARLRVDELKPKQQYFFGLDADMAKEAAKKEAIAIASYESTLRQYMIEKEAAEKKAAIAKLRDERAAKTQQILLAAQEPAVERRSTLSAPPPRPRAIRASTKRVRRSNYIYYSNNYNNLQPGSSCLDLCNQNSSKNLYEKTK
jgi:hypothetical protein